ncbi:unnamed protein product [Amoebophrya sp. A25]|nr:unnamed protein product [Amoebophrya sp. A25]|eukprot:GSA25T00002331001.1
MTRVLLLFAFLKSVVLFFACCRAEKFLLAGRALPDPNVLHVISYTTLTSDGLAPKITFFLNAEEVPDGLQLHVIHADLFNRINPDRFCCKRERRRSNTCPDALDKKFVPPPLLQDDVEALQTEGNDVSINSMLRSWTLVGRSDAAKMDYKSALGDAAVGASAADGDNGLDNRSSPRNRGETKMLLPGNLAPSSVPATVKQGVEASRGGVGEDGAGRRVIDKDAELVAAYGKRLRKGLYFVVLTNCGVRSATHLQIRSGYVDLITYSALPAPSFRMHDRMFRRDEKKSLVTFYLPAADIPKLPFYGILFGLYTGLLIAWVLKTFFFSEFRIAGSPAEVEPGLATLSSTTDDQFAGKQEDDTPQAQLKEINREFFWRTVSLAGPVHHMVTQALAVAVLESFCWYCALAHWNLVGRRWHGMVVLASLSTALKQGISLALLLLACLGRGVVSDNGQPTSRQRGGILLLLALYVLTDTYRRTVTTMEQRPKGGAPLPGLDVPERYRGGSLLLVMLPASLFLGIFVSWITSALDSTITYLMERRETQKESMYRNMRSYVLFPIGVAVFLVLWFEVAFVRNIDLAHNWETRWLFTDLALHAGHLTLLLAVCWLWLPSERTAYLAGAFQLRNDEENELPETIGRPDTSESSPSSSDSVLRGENRKKTEKERRQPTRALEQHEIEIEPEGGVELSEFEKEIKLGGSSAVALE